MRSKAAIGHHPIHPMLVALPIGAFVTATIADVLYTARHAAMWFDVARVSIAIGLLFIGVPNAMLFGCLAGVLRFIPVIGPWLGAVLPLLLAMAVFDGWHQMFYVLALFGGVELTINTAVEPWLYGASTGISGVAIVVAILF